jgi:DNA polymerase III epsilon subunit-like protein
MPSNSMQHWNGCQVCVIDTETTGLDPHFHEIWEICILPVDSDFNVRKDVFPFHITMKPEHPERVNDEANRLSKGNIAKACREGHDQEKAKELLDHWWNKLDLPYNAYGSRQCTVIPLGQNYGYDRGFIQRWLGTDLYGDYFHYHYRDTMTTALYLNDRAASRGEPVPFSKVNLSYLASTLKIPHERAHTALDDCNVTRQVYQRMQKMGGLLT